MSEIQGGDLLVRGGDVVSEKGVSTADVLVRNGTVAAVGVALEAPAGCAVIEAAGKLVFPGVVDPQVHFREPGNEHKEDLASGSLTAVAGGVTTVMEMPNTKPPTTGRSALQDKLDRAAGRMWCDHAFFVGATPENAGRLGDLEQAPGCAGVKVFMGSSTGSLLVDDDATLEKVLRSGSRRVAVHSEHEPRLRERYAAIEEGTIHTQHPIVRDIDAAVIATKRLLNLVEKTGRRVHLLHVSTGEEVDLLRERDLGELVTAEVTPNHLFLEAPDCYERWGALVQMNPPVRDLRHQAALRQGLADGVIACIGSDHAPHSLEEKERPYPQSPSGIPGVQTILPLLLTAVREGWLTMADVARVACSGAADVYGMTGKGRLVPGSHGDIVVVNPGERGPLRLEWLRSRAGYSPYVGMRLEGWPETTIVRGNVVYQDHHTVGEPTGRPLTFTS